MHIGKTRKVFKKEQSVILVVPITDWLHGSEDGILVPAGTIGTVRKRYEKYNQYLVEFQGFPGDGCRFDNRYDITDYYMRVLSPLEQLAQCAEEEA